MAERQGRAAIGWAGVVKAAARAQIPEKCPDRRECQYQRGVLPRGQAARGHPRPI